ncbi:uncharacterized protein LOC127855985 [Dreissena polymorpha]|uniref:2',3'-cyclic-nucleotide 3'-phosphodiesterase n=1 Tax=Dreissena polymorpha TaxID=45954 RepID=A0A9D4C0I9_DREPO|nr:uncharacterized protein LOC127855985 [Dreissena polymorpha]KAH3714898.1 hypothetical protein DPMN_057600 [Dreissena polymorpha]
MISIVFGTAWIIKHVMAFFGIRPFIYIPDDDTNDKNDNAIIPLDDAGKSEYRNSYHVAYQLNPVYNVYDDDVVITDITPGSNESLNDLGIKTEENQDTLANSDAIIGNYVSGHTGDSRTENVIVIEDDIEVKKLELATATKPVADLETDCPNVIPKLENCRPSTKTSVNDARSPPSIIIDNDQNNGDDDVEILGMYPVSEPKPGTSQDEEFDLTTIHGYDSMPFLSDASTIEYIKTSHTIFIMRGLPGSGKSTLVRGLEQVYPGAVVCSADQYFMDSSGKYCYDHKKIEAAHMYCQSQAESSCSNNMPVIIIDNTNIQRWNMAFYFKLAQSSYYYHTVVVEAQTPWRYNPRELAARNHHNVDLEMISQKLRSLQDNKLRPYYYGWFLRQCDSLRLVAMATETLARCARELQDRGLALDVADFMTRTHKGLGDLYTAPKKMLHCTAGFMGTKGSNSYHENKTVLSSLGKTFKLAVTGLVFTGKTVCAVVDLYHNNTAVEKNEISKEQQDDGPGNSDIKNQLDNSSQNDEEVEESLSANDTSTLSETPLKKRRSELLKLFMKEEEVSLREKYEGVKKGVGYSSRQSVFRRGCSAHVTISYSKNGLAKYSGDEILRICELEFHGKRLSEIETEVGKVRSYESDTYQVLLKEPVVFDTLFHGFYNSKK